MESNLHLLDGPALLQVIDNICIGKLVGGKGNLLLFFFIYNYIFSEVVAGIVLEKALHNQLASTIQSFFLHSTAKDKQQRKEWVQGVTAKYFDDIKKV